MTFILVQLQRGDSVPFTSAYRDMTQRDPPPPLVGLIDPLPIIAEDPSPDVTEDAINETRSNPDTSHTFHSLAVESSDPESANCTPRKRKRHKSDME